VCTKRVSKLAETSDGYILTRLVFRAYIAHGTDVPVHDMKAYGGNAPLILNFCVCGQIHGPAAFFPGDSPPVPIQKGGGVGVELDSLRVLKNSLAPSKNLTTSVDCLHKD
jgi:hypothetical protein